MGCQARCQPSHSGAEEGLEEEKNGGGEENEEKDTDARSEIQRWDQDEGRSMIKS